MKVTLEALLADFRAGKGPGFVLAHGDSFRVRTACKAIVDLLVPQEKRVFNLEQIPGLSAPWEQVEVALRTPPFFDGCKVVWVENAPYFAPSERKIGGEALLELWGEGKKEQAAKALLQLLAGAGWTEQRWESTPEASIASAAADQLSQSSGDGQEARIAIEAIVEFCRQQGWAPQPEASLAESLMAFLEEHKAPGTVLLLSAQDVDRRTRVYRKLTETGAVLDLGLERDSSGRISRDAVAAFVQEHLHSTGKKVEARAREAILERAGTELWAVHQELEKLVLFVGKEPEIKVAHVEAVFRDQSEAWVFDLTDAIGQRNAARALTYLADLLDQGEHPLRILAVIAAEVRKLLTARQLIDGELRGRWRKEMTYAQFQSRVLERREPLITRSPYADYLCLQKAESFATADLLRHLRRIYLTDIRLKTSSASSRMAMERLIVEMCSGAGSSDDSATEPL